ncbi:MAG TPA: anthranilate phosphoribosyltransferase [Pseudomonadales bacterium]
MKIQTVIAQLVERRDLSADTMRKAMTAIMTGNATDAQIAAFLVALRMKGETVDEIAAAAAVMRDLSISVPVTSPATVDTCGTGGDGSSLFNVSTASAFIVAAAGGKVAKHGNRSVTSTCGSADLLEAAGASLELNAEQVARAIDQIGVGFMFAVKHHGAMKHAIGPRREIAIRTLFNVLGPLTNPAGSRHQVLGVYDKQWLRPLAEVLQKLGSRHVLVVHSDDGLDELSVAAPSQVAELKDGVISEYTITPEQFGLQRHSLDALKVSSAQESLGLIKQAYRDVDSAAGQMLALNAGAAIYAADLANSLAQGVTLAQDIMATGQAQEKFNEFIEYTRMVAVTS